MQTLTRLTHRIRNWVGGKRKPAIPPVPIATNPSGILGGTGPPFPCGGMAETPNPDWQGQWRKQGKVSTCTMCSGIKRADLRRLIEEGAWLEPTTKGYKFYFGGHPDCEPIFGASKYYVWHPEDLPDLNDLFGQLRPVDGERFKYKLPKFISESG